MFRDRKRISRKTIFRIFALPAVKKSASNCELLIVALTCALNAVRNENDYELCAVPHRMHTMRTESAWRKVRQWWEYNEEFGAERYVVIDS